MQKSIAVCAFLILGLMGCYAQSAKEFLKKGETQYQAKEFENALKTYQEGLKAYPQDARLNFFTGLTYLSLPNKAESLRYLQTSFTINPSIDDRIYYYLGLSYQYNRQYQKSEEFFNEYKKRHPDQADQVDKKIRQLEYADSLTHAPSTAIFKLPDLTINSSFHEYSPLVSSDGNTMIFTSNRPDQASQQSGLPSFEDIYISKRVDGQWTKPEKISPNINIRFNDAAASLSPDGKTLILYYEYGLGDIYVSKLNGSEWSTPVELNQNINTPGFWEASGYLTADGKKLYFTSNRPGGVGNLDIYVSEMEETGDWGKATNLGPVINTKGREDSPSVDKDGKTLYFSSDGHPTMGGTDIFKSEFKDGKWQKPVNMGHPINSVEDDSFFAVTEDRKRAYFSTLREEGNAEIYTLTFIEPDQAIADVVTPAVNAPGVASQSTVGTPHTLQKVSIVEFDSLTEAENLPPIAPIFVGEPDPEYVRKRGLENTPIPENKVAKESVVARQVPKEKSPVKPDLQPVRKTAPPVASVSKPPASNAKTASTYRSGSKRFLFFATGKDDLNNESERKLEDVYALLTSDAAMHSLIEGHTDNTGSDLLNNALSIKRANAVAKYLTRRGIEPQRLAVKAYGARKPLVSNDDEIGGRELNRRIEIGFLR